MTRMFEVHSDRAGRPDELVASGSAIEWRYQDDKAVLSLRGGKMLHVLVKAAADALTEHTIHSMPLSKLKEISHMSPSEIKKVAHELVETSVETIISDPEPMTLIGPILDHIAISHDNNGLMRFRFSSTMIKLFQKDDRWTILSKEIVMGFESRYALRLFEILSLRRALKRRKERFEISDLRARLGVEKDKLKSFSDFRVRCLNPAVVEVSRAMDMLVTFEPIKTGKAVTSIELSWTDPLTDVAKDHLAPKFAPVEPEAIPAPPEPIGLEPPRPRFAFPIEGSVRDVHPWHAIAETHCPGYDMDLLTKGFRSLAGRKQDGFPLKGPDLEARFVAYCRTKAFATASARARQAAIARHAAEAAGRAQCRSDGGSDG